MKLPTLGQMVFYTPLVDEPAQAFIAAGGRVGEAVIQPAAKTTGKPRAATVIHVADDPREGRATLLVYKHPGDPSRDAVDAVIQRVAAVPYSAEGTAGTWMDADDVSFLQQLA